LVTIAWTMGEENRTSTALAKRAPRDHHARAYRAMAEARRVLLDPAGYRAGLSEEERRGLFEECRSDLCRRSRAISVERQLVWPAS
jgi:hypothetical protein